MHACIHTYIPIRKMLRPITYGSATWPKDIATWITTIANIPATKLPRALLNPRLNVAPAHPCKLNLIFIPCIS